MFTMNERTKNILLKGIYVVTGFLLFQFLVGLTHTMAYGLIMSHRPFFDFDLESLWSLLTFVLQLGFYLVILYTVRKKCRSAGIKVTLKDYFHYYGIYNLLLSLVLFFHLIPALIIYNNSPHELKLNILYHQSASVALNVAWGSLLLWLGLRHATRVNL